MGDTSSGSGPEIDRRSALLVDFRLGPAMIDGMTEPIKRQCEHCKNEIKPSEGRIMVPHKGKMLVLCSQECRKRIAKKK